MVDARLHADDRTATLNRAEAVDLKEARADLREAYDRGRKDERASRRRHPIVMTLLWVAAIVGVIVLALAAVNGSFQSAGAAIDQGLASAVNRSAAG